MHSQCLQVSARSGATVRRSNTLLIHLIHKPSATIDSGLQVDPCWMLPTEKVLLVTRETPSQWGIFLFVSIHLLLGDWLQRSLLERSRMLEAAECIGCP